ncbi:hypothetical protein IWX50DRAFT_616286 [Phyllosticta citricarpa]
MDENQPDEPTRGGGPHVAREASNELNRMWQRIVKQEEKARDVTRMLDRQPEDCTDARHQHIGEMRPEGQEVPPDPSAHPDPSSAQYRAALVMRLQESRRRLAKEIKLWEDAKKGKFDPQDLADYDRRMGLFGDQSVAGQRDAPSIPRGRQNQDDGRSGSAAARNQSPSATMSDLNYQLDVKNEAIDVQRRDIEGDKNVEAGQAVVGAEEVVNEVVVDQAAETHDMEQRHAQEIHRLREQVNDIDPLRQDVETLQNQIRVLRAQNQALSSTAQQCQHLQLHGLRAGPHASSSPRQAPRSDYATVAPRDIPRPQRVQSTDHQAELTRMLQRGDQRHQIAASLKSKTANAALRSSGRHRDRHTPCADYMRVTPSNIPRPSASSWLIIRISWQFRRPQPAVRDLKQWPLPARYSLSPWWPATWVNHAQSHQDLVNSLGEQAVRDTGRINSSTTSLFTTRNALGASLARHSTPVARQHLPSTHTQDITAVVIASRVSQQVPIMIRTDREQSLTNLTTSLRNHVTSLNATIQRVHETLETRLSHPRTAFRVRPSRSTYLENITSRVSQRVPILIHTDREQSLTNLTTSLENQAMQAASHVAGSNATIQRVHETLETHLSRPRAAFCVRPSHSTYLDNIKSVASTPRHREQVLPQSDQVKWQTDLVNSLARQCKVARPGLSNSRQTVNQSNA